MAEAVDLLTNAMAGIEPPKKGRRKKIITTGYQHFWIQDGDAFSLPLPDNQHLKIVKELDKWAAFGIINNKKFKGLRDKLEQAFKAVDQILYKENKDYWLKTNVQVVIAPWAADLNL